MTRPKSVGGMGLPDFRQYYQAIQIARVLDWNCHADTKDWIFIERSFSTSTLGHTPWIPLPFCPKPLLRHPLTGPTLRTFQQAIEKGNLSSIPGPLTPLANNPEFIPGVDNPFLFKKTNSPFLATDCFDKGTFKLKRAFGDLSHRRP